MSHVDPYVKALISVESVSEAVQYARRSGVRPSHLSRCLTERAAQVAADRPAEAAALSFMADVMAQLDKVQLWPAAEQLSSAANEVLREASSATSLIDAVRILQARADVLGPEVTFPVLTWHADLAQRGVPPEANGLCLVLATGVVLGGTALAWAHLSWSRNHESSSSRRAEIHLRRAIVLMRAHGSADDQGIAATALREFHRRHGTPDPTSQEPVHKPESLAATITLNENRAHDLRNAGRYGEALSLLNRTLELASDLGGIPSRLRLLILRGLVLDDISEYALAERDFRLASTLAEELGDEQRGFEAHNNLAGSYLKRGEPRRAVTAFKDILARVEAAGRFPRRPAAMNNLATAYAKAGDDRAAIRWYREALAALEGMQAGGSSVIALSGLAEAYSNTSQEDVLREVGAELLRLWVEEGSEQALLAYLNCPAADYGVREVVTVAKQAWESLLSARDFFSVGALTMNLALHEARSGKPRQALSRLDRFLTTFESERTRLQVCVAAEVRAAELEARDLRRPKRAVGRLRAAVARAEKLLAQVERSEDGDLLLGRVRPLYDRLIELLVHDGAHNALVEAFWLHEASRPMTLTRSLVGALPGEKRTIAGRVAGFDDVRRAMAAETRRLGVASLVETDDLVGAFVVTGASQRPTWIALELTQDALFAASQEISAAFNGDSAAFPPKRPRVANGVGALSLERVGEVARALGQILPAVDGCDLVCLVPSPNTGGLPLSAMVGPDGERLVRRASVIMEPSVTALVEIALDQRPSRAPEQVLVAGVAAAEDIRADFFETDATMFDDLGVAVHVLRSNAATPRSVLAGLAVADVAHLACHGFVDSHDSLGSGLLLSNGTERPSRRRQSVPVFERGAFELTVRDLAETSFKTTLLTMRACSTSRRATVAAKEEISTLNRAFHAAGCQTVVSALWNVDQQSSLALFRSFYTLVLRQDISPCDAMRQAQVAMISTGGDHSHIYHWAPFIISGDWKWRSHAG